MKPSLRRGLSSGIAVGSIGLAMALSFWLPGGARVGSEGHRLSATPGAVLLSAPAGDSRVVPTPVREAGAGTAAEDATPRALALATRDPMQRRFLDARQTVDALPAEQRAALEVTVEASKAEARARLT